MFLAKFFDKDADIDMEWEDILSDDLGNPRFKITWQEAVKRRLKRIYIWIILIFLAAWIGKIYMHPSKVTTWEAFFGRISGPLGTPAGILIFGAIMGSIAVSTLYFFYSSRGREATGGPKERDIDEEFASKKYVEKFEEKNKEEECD